MLRFLCYLSGQTTLDGPICRRDSKIYAATCAKLGPKRVAFKAYDAANISAAKQRSVKREARIMKYLTLKRCAGLILLYMARTCANGRRIAPPLSTTISLAYKGALPPCLAAFVCHVLPQSHAHCGAPPNPWPLRRRVPNVVQFLGAFREPDLMCIVMERCSGGDLLERLLQARAIPYQCLVLVQPLSCIIYGFVRPTCSRTAIKGLAAGSGNALPRPLTVLQHRRCSLMIANVAEMSHNRIAGWASHERSSRCEPGKTLEPTPFAMHVAVHARCTHCKARAAPHIPARRKRLPKYAHRTAPPPLCAVTRCRGG